MVRKYRRLIFIVSIIFIITFEDALKNQWREITGRPILKDTAAIKSGKVFVLSRRAVSGPQTVIGLVYVAKWLHPQLFRDMDPEAVQREMIEKYYQLSYAGGSYGYSKPQ